MEYLQAYLLHFPTELAILKTTHGRKAERARASLVYLHSPETLPSYCVAMKGKALKVQREWQKKNEGKEDRKEERNDQHGLLKPTHVKVLYNVR